MTRLVLALLALLVASIAARAADPCAGTVTSGSGDVVVEGKQAARAGDAGDQTGCGGSIVSDASGVFINGKPMARVGDAACCGGKETPWHSLLVAARMARPSAWQGRTYRHGGHHELRLERTAARDVSRLRHHRHPRGHRHDRATAVLHELRPRASLDRLSDPCRGRSDRRPIGEGASGEPQRTATSGSQATLLASSPSSSERNGSSAATRSL